MMINRTISIMNNIEWILSNRTLIKKDFQTTTNDENIDNLNQIINYIIFYISLLIIGSGTIGSLCNIITFTSRKLCFNSCVFYFLCSTIFDLLYLLLSGITRILIDNFSSILPNASILFCKFRTYLVVVIPLLSTNFLMLASMDRCFSTSSTIKWRNFSRINIARRISLITLIISIFSTAHILFIYDLRKEDFMNDKYKCVPHNDIYKTFITICFFLINPFTTYTIMFVCTLITLTRIRTSKYRVGSLHNRRRKRRKTRRNDRINQHLITLSFVQVGLGIIFTFFRCGFLVYSFLTINIKKNTFRINTETFFDKFSLVIYYMNFAKSFPVNTLTSPLFRRIFRQRLNYFIRWLWPFTSRQRKSIIKTKNQL